MIKKLFILIIVLAISGVFSMFGLDLPTAQVADDSLLRIRLKDTWLLESPDRVMARRAVLQTLANGERVEVRVEQGREEFMVIFAREMMSGRIAADNRPAVARAGTGQFPGWAQGSWMLTRRKDNGRAVLIRVFLRSDQYAYVQFRPFSGDKCLMDVVLYGGFAAQSIPLPIPFERLYTVPVNDVLKLAGDKFPGKYFDPYPEDYDAQRKFIAQVRLNLPDLSFADDGAIDENGDYVFIDTLERQNSGQNGLNCSGFVKWMIDGILKPVTGERLAIPPLKAPFGERGSSFTENWEEKRDPYFGLDWIRNLASEAGTVLRSAAYRSLEEIEVRSEKFPLVMVPVNKSFVTNSNPGFLEFAGFGIEGLHPMLYTLAIDEPGRFYLAAINTETGPAATKDNPRGAPRLRQYFHIAALIPYFDEQGVFRITVFESAAETSFNAFKNRYPGHHVNLVRIPVKTTFDP